MALHEQSVGATDEWYTPAHVFEAMGQRFDLDPAHPAFAEIPATAWCDASFAINGLTRDWRGVVWMNPPFGARNGIVPWLEKFFAHGCGVALVPDRTSAPWWQRFAPMADGVLFVSPKIRFIAADGSEGRSPAQGTALLGIGKSGLSALENASRNGLGRLFHPVRSASEAKGRQP